MIRKRKTARPVPNHISASDAIAFDLTPEGIEFDVIAPNPFSSSAADPIDPATGLRLRLRLAPTDNGDGLAGLQLRHFGRAAMGDLLQPVGNGPNHNIRGSSLGGLARKSRRHSRRRGDKAQ